VLASIFIGSCATKPNIIIKENEAEILRNRIKEYWQFKIDGKIEQAYPFEIPAYRAKVSILEYGNQFKLVKYLEADVSGVRIEGDQGKATVNISYKMLLQHIAQKSLLKRVEENWVKRDEIWYHIPEGFEM